MSTFSRLFARLAALTSLILAGSIALAIIYVLLSPEFALRWFYPPQLHYRTALFIGLAGALYFASVDLLCLKSTAYQLNHLKVFIVLSCLVVMATPWFVYYTYFNSGQFNRQLIESIRHVHSQPSSPQSPSSSSSQSQPQSYLLVVDNRQRIFTESLLMKFSPASTYNYSMLLRNTTLTDEALQSLGDFLQVAPRVLLVLVLLIDLFQAIAVLCSFRYVYTRILSCGDDDEYGAATKYGGGTTYLKDTSRALNGSSDSQRDEKPGRHQHHQEQEAETCDKVETAHQMMSQPQKPENNLRSVDSNFELPPMPNESVIEEAMTSALDRQKNGRINAESTIKNTSKKCPPPPQLTKIVIESNQQLHTDPSYSSTNNQASLAKKESDEEDASSIQRDDDFDDDDEKHEFRLSGASSDMIVVMNETKFDENIQYVDAEYLAESAAVKTTAEMLHKNSAAAPTNEDSENDNSKANFICI